MVRLYCVLRVSNPCLSSFSYRVLSPVNHSSSCFVLFLKPIVLEFQRYFLTFLALSDVIAFCRPFRPSLIPSPPTVPDDYVGTRDALSSLRPTPRNRTVPNSCGALHSPPIHCWLSVSAIFTRTRYFSRCLEVATIAVTVYERRRNEDHGGIFWIIRKLGDT